jgi:hypothetical protein
VWDLSSSPSAAKKKKPDSKYYLRDDSISVTFSGQTQTDHWLSGSRDGGRVTLGGTKEYLENELFYILTVIVVT